MEVNHRYSEDRHAELQAGQRFSLFDHLPSSLQDWKINFFFLSLEDIELSESHGQWIEFYFKNPCRRVTNLSAMKDVAEKRLSIMLLHGRIDARDLARGQWSEAEHLLRPMRRWRRVVAVSGCGLLAQVLPGA